MGFVRSLQRVCKIDFVFPMKQTETKESSFVRKANIKLACQAGKRLAPS